MNYASREQNALLLLNLLCDIISNIVILVENGLVPRTKRAASGAFRVKAEADFQVELLYNGFGLQECHQPIK